MAQFNPFWGDDDATPPPDMSSSTDVDMSGMVDDGQFMSVVDTSEVGRLPDAAMPDPPGPDRSQALREERQRRQGVRADIRRARKTGDRDAAEELASQERMARHQRGEWDDSLDFPTPESMGRDAAGAPQQPEPAPQPEPTPQQRRLTEVAQQPMPEEMWAFPGGGNDEAVNILREMLTELKTIASKMDTDAKWGT